MSTSVVALATTRRVVLSEFVKFRTLPSHVLGSIVALVILAGFGTLAAYAGSLQGAAELLPSTALLGIQGTQLLVAIVAVLFMTAEFNEGTIQPTFFAAPRRLRALVAKATVLGATGFLTGALGGLLALAGASLVTSAESIRFVLPPELAAQMVLGSGCYLLTIAVLALGLGAVIRNLVGSLLTAIGLLTVAPFALGVVPVEWVQRCISYLPSTAGLLVLQPENPAATLTPWAGVGVAGAWAAASFLAALVSIRTSDA